MYHIICLINTNTISMKATLLSLISTQELSNIISQCEVHGVSIDVDKLVIDLSINELRELYSCLGFKHAHYVTGFSGRTEVIVIYELAYRTKILGLTF